MSANRKDFINQEAKPIIFFRIIDNMPVTWCYDVEDGQKYCNPGFPIGCLVTLDGRAKDACVINVSWDFCRALYLTYYVLPNRSSACEVVLILIYWVLNL